MNELIQQKKKNLKRAISCMTAKRAVQWTCGIHTVYNMALAGANPSLPSLSSLLSTPSQSTKNWLAGNFSLQTEHRVQQPQAWWHNTVHFNPVTQLLLNYKQHLEKQCLCLPQVPAAKPVRNTVAQFTEQHIQQAVLPAATGTQLTTEKSLFFVDHQLVPHAL